MSLKSLNIDKTWTLFLDRDGMINKKIENDYVRNVSQFKLIPSVIDGLKILRKIFGKIIRGIGRGLMKKKRICLIYMPKCWNH